MITAMALIPGILVVGLLGLAATAALALLLRFVRADGLGHRPPPASSREWWAGTQWEHLP